MQCTLSSPSPLLNVCSAKGTPSSVQLWSRTPTTLLALLCPILRLSSMKTRLLASAMTFSLAVTLTGCAPEPGSPTSQAPATATPHLTAWDVDKTQLREAVSTLEHQYAARVGVMVIDVDTRRSVGSRHLERFGFASTVKAFVAAALLRATTPDERQTRLSWTQSDLEAAGYSPVTTESLASGLTVGELAEAAVRESDNLATNLVIEFLGGPDALTAELDAAGDRTTQIRDFEPDLNNTTATDAANTTTPAAFAELLRELVAGEYLQSEDRATLLDWMSGNASGDQLIRAAAPTDWVIADKSGGAGGKRNDIAVAYPPSGSPVIIAIFTEKTTSGEAYDNALVASVAAAVFAGLGG